jgi:hypothetical protein
VLASSALCAATVACFDSPPPVAEIPTEIEVPPLPEPEALREETRLPMYGEDGALLPSDVSVAGLVLPRGAELVVQTERNHVYRTTAPLTKVLSYLGPRLVTGAVERSAGGGATYVDAVPREARGAQVHIDVAIRPSSMGGTRIEITERAPAMANPPPESESLRRLREWSAQAD